MNMSMKGTRVQRTGRGQQWAWARLQVVQMCDGHGQGHPRAAHGARAAVGVGKIAGGPDV